MNKSKILNLTHDSKEMDPVSLLNMHIVRVYICKCIPMYIHNVIYIYE